MFFGRDDTLLCGAIVSSGIVILNYYFQREKVFHRGNPTATLSLESLPFEN